MKFVIVMILLNANGEPADKYYPQADWAACLQQAEAVGAICVTVPADKSPPHPVSWDFN